MSNELKKEAERLEKYADKREQTTVGKTNWGLHLDADARAAAKEARARADKSDSGDGSLDAQSAFSDGPLPDDVIDGLTGK